MKRPGFLSSHGSSLQFPGVDIWVHSLCNTEYLVSSDFHLMHFERATIFLKSLIPLCSDDLMVMSPHGLVAVTNLFMLSLRPSATPAMVTRSLYLLPVLLFGDSDNYLICVWTCETVPWGWLHIWVSHVLSGCIWVGWGPTVVGIALTVLISQCSLRFPQLYHCTRISSGLGLTGRGTGRFLSMWIQSCSLAFGANSGMFSLPFVELCSLLTLTSWESTWVCFLNWSPMCNPGRVVPLFLAWGSTMNPGKWVSNQGSGNKGDIPPGEALGKVESHVWWPRLSEGNRSCEPSSSGAVVVTGMSSLCCAVMASTSFM